MGLGKKKKWLLGTGIGILVIVGVLAWAHRTQTAWVESAPYTRMTDAPTQVLVVVYSRTGNTLGAAKEAARFFDADLLRIEAPGYPRSLRGQFRAAEDADEEVTTTEIEHDPVDLSRYELVILCSPTWWFRPAPPLWTFVEENDFAGRSVFLLMTGNSRLTEERTGKFGVLVEDQGGRFVGYHFLRRGRIYWQKSSEALHAELREFLSSRVWEGQ